jgi:hypothetical protein
MVEEVSVSEASGLREEEGREESIGVAGIEWLVGIE